MKNIRNAGASPFACELESPHDRTVTLCRNYRRESVWRMLHRSMYGRFYLFLDTL